MSRSAKTVRGKAKRDQHEHQPDRHVGRGKPAVEATGRTTLGSCETTSGLPVRRLS